MSPGQRDPATHFWYNARDDRYRRVCDDEAWPLGAALVSAASDVYVPCTECRSLYVEDMVRGDMRLSATPVVEDLSDSVVYSPKLGGYPQENVEHPMEIGNVALATFARFSEASMSQRVRVVRDARLFRSDPESYTGRDYYFDLRNTLRKTHWQPGAGSIEAFEAALDTLLAKADKVKGRADHYEAISEAYITFWKKQDAQFFPVAPSNVELAGLSIHVTAEVGMRYDGNNLALKLILTAPKQTRHFRQVIQFLSDEAFLNRPNLQPAIWDVRRGEILPRVPIPKDFRLALEGDAAAFRHMWGGMDRETEI